MAYVDPATGVRKLGNKKVELTGRAIAIEGHKVTLDTSIGHVTFTAEEDEEVRLLGVGPLLAVTVEGYLHKNKRIVVTRWWSSF